MKYTPIALQYVLNDSIHASSGVYITQQLSTQPFILTVNHVPRIGEYLIYANFGDNSSPSQISWHRVSVLEEVAINASDFEFFDSHQFNLYPRDQYGKALSILKLSPPPAVTAAATATGSVARKSTTAIGDQVTIVSSPFNFTNSLIFHQFTTTARIVYKVHAHEHDADDVNAAGDYWLSDAAYMENMAGGAVIEKPLNADITNGSENKLVGLVLGNLRKINGDGNLMVIIPMKKIIQISPTLIPPPPTPQSNSLIKSSSSILYKTLSSTTLSKLFNLPSISTKITTLRTTPGDAKSVLPLIINASNHRTWGSCIFYKDQLLITNSHVVAPFFQKAHQSTGSINSISNRRKLYFDSTTSDNATILITNHGDSIQVTSPLDKKIIVPHPDLDLAFIQIDHRASTLLLENGYRPIAPCQHDSIAEGDSVYTQSYGLFFDPLYLQPLKSHGIINCIYRNDNGGAGAGAGLIIASASCFNGSSGGGLFTSANDQLVGMICSNAKVYKPLSKDDHQQQKHSSGKDTEKLTTFTFVLPVGIIDYCYQQMYQNKIKPKIKIINEDADVDDRGLVNIDSKILDLWKLKPFHKDIYIDPKPVPTLTSKAKL